MCPFSLSRKQLDVKNENRRYLQCPGMVKIVHLKKFVSNKYGLIDNFMVDIIYNEELIPEQYTLIDVAYLYNWRKDKPMQFYYRVFKKNTVLLRKRKIDSIVTNGTAYVKKASSEITNPRSPVKKEPTSVTERKSSTNTARAAPLSPSKQVKSQNQQQGGLVAKPKPTLIGSWKRSVLSRKRPGPAEADRNRSRIPVSLSTVQLLNTNRTRCLMILNLNLISRPGRAVS